MPLWCFYSGPSSGPLVYRKRKLQRIEVKSNLISDQDLLGNFRDLKNLEFCLQEAVVTVPGCLRSQTCDPVPLSRRTETVAPPAAPLMASLADYGWERKYCMECSLRSGSAEAICHGPPSAAGSLPVPLDEAQPPSRSPSVSPCGQHHPAEDKLLET